MAKKPMKGGKHMMPGGHMMTDAQMKKEMKSMPKGSKKK